ncbi:lipopolysaccharide biosynthesis protein [Elizabethkingia anophelis]|uniref:lipopolysaccharide biosynthesis protein n=1 Tax=Elizabethkingia anophelis TaxID=1117645 RepID=UPI00099AC00A|nr:MATE family efflux transporter [Elizabethkingia anophelis]MCT4287930.1 hypothetical protein [Elizabethkingia anophelis]MCT4315776.1 hypothetical protein [Elizabethkingia anophelis]MDV3880393.1 hypothetical protein [Elizabethkingia anophelis]OPC31764.1 hypothetical protein BAX98_06900 [Elizabethkingia anophelis]
MLQTKKNLLFNFIALIVNIAVGFLYTPYLVKKMGIIAYGVLPLAMIISQYISILTTSLTGTLTRFYAVEINNNNYNKASSYLSGALLVILGIILCCIPILILVIWNIKTLFNIPNVFIDSAKVLFIFTFLSFFFSLISSFFNIVLYADNRLDLLNQINIIRVSSKVILNIILFETISVDIKFVGIGNFIGEFIVVIFAYILYKRIISQNISIHLNNFEKSIFGSLLAMTLWVMMHQLGDLAIYKTDILFVNKFWSTKESGILGAISDFGSYIMMFIGAISSLFGPLILIAYSKKNHDEVKEMALNNCLLIGLITALAVSLLIGFSSEFLGLWLGKEYIHYHLWLDFKLLYLPFYAASGVFAFVYRSWNKVKLPAIMTVVLGVITIIITYLISKYGNTSIFYIKYILISNTILSVLQTYILGAYMVRLVYPDIRKKLIVLIALKIVIVMILVVVLSRMITRYFIIDNWILLITCIVIVGVLGMLLIYFLFINKDQRKYLFGLLLKNNSYV